MQTAMEKELRDKREIKFRSLRTKSGKSNMLMKSEEEKQQEARDKDTVEKQLKHATFQKAQDVFYGGKTQARNPWRMNVGKTMFWM